MTYLTQMKNLNGFIWKGIIINTYVLGKVLLKGALPFHGYGMTKFRTTLRRIGTFYRHPSGCQRISNRLAWRNKECRAPWQQCQQRRRLAWSGQHRRVRFSKEILWSFVKIWHILIRFSFRKEHLLRIINQQNLNGDIPLKEHMLK